MNIELVTYLILVFQAILLSFRNRPPKSWCIIILSIFYVIGMRISSFDVDILTYANAMHKPVNEMISNSYYYKEFIYWFTTSFLYSIFNIEIAVFIVIDFLLLILLYRIVVNFKLPAYAFPLIIIFFPSIFGFQNIYRQYISIVFFLYALSLTHVHKKFNFLYFVSFFIHNSTFLFFPLPLLLLNRDLFKQLGSIIHILILLTIPIAGGLKSSFNTGNAMGLFYTIISFLIFLFFLYIKKLKISYKPEIVLSLYFFSIVLVSFYFLGERAERIGLVMFMCILPYLILAVEKNSNYKYLYRLILIVILVSPTFLFSSTRSFIF
jgi:hypothetical protein